MPAGESEGGARGGREDNRGRQRHDGEGVRLRPPQERPGCAGVFHALGVQRRGGRERQRGLGRPRRGVRQHRGDRGRLLADQRARVREGRPEEVEPEADEAADQGGAQEREGLQRGVRGLPHGHGELQELHRRLGGARLREGARGPLLSEGLARTGVQERHGEVRALAAGLAPHAGHQRLRHLPLLPRLRPRRGRQPPPGPEQGAEDAIPIHLSLSLYIYINMCIYIYVYTIHV